ncbi:LysR family transcriptional regulator [Burkholderia sp. Ac-20365]|uniref:LysR substrate-binding domain-containing protein n=1 Tax=Burkholderia sp. Ac-20365 TaxID=2703897 RepID=UPI00197BD91F|nr:LysR family transcriptional regulator [Burkholderia sp. Ac-20365]
MNQIQAMRVFVRVVELASFSAAARQLGMSAAATTRSVMTLEAHLNLRLLNRSTRHVSLTDEGQLYLDGCREIIDQLDAMESSLVRSTRELNGTLRVSTSSSFAMTGLCSLLAAYRGFCPRVSFDITTNDEPVSLIEGGFDVGFSDDPNMPDSALISRQLKPVKQMVVASPRYLQKHGAPSSPRDLASHHLLTISNGPSKSWKFTDGSETYRIPAGSALQASSCATIRCAALADMGVAMLPTPLVEEDVAEGSLVPVLNQFEIADGMRQVSILYTSRNYLSARVRHFIDFSVNHYRAPYARSLMRVVA